MSNIFPTMQEITQVVGGRLEGEGSLCIQRLAHPADANSATDLGLAFEDNLLPLLDSPPLQAVIVRGDATIVAPNIKAIIRIDRPRLAMAKLTAMFARPLPLADGIHPTAIIEEGARIGTNVRIGAMVHIASGAVIGDNCAIYPHASIGHNAVIGEGGVILSGVRIAHEVQIGKRCLIHYNTTIGADGFSFVTPEAGSVESAKSTGAVTAVNTALVRIASLGTVIIGDDVEIGANTSIDRGTIRATRIGDGTKIDNQVQIGHNVVIGKGCLICGRVGIAGSATLGDRVVLGGATGVADHVTIGDDAIAMGMSGVAGNLPARALVMGIPAVPRDEAISSLMNIRRIKPLLRRLGELEARVAKMDEAIATSQVTKNIDK